jgi:hypothetical protein
MGTWETNKFNPVPNYVKANHALERVANPKENTSPVDSYGTKGQAPEALDLYTTYINL